jgi:diguanylate cyclase (GGDEF)-like protein
MRFETRSRELGTLLALAAAYFLAGRLGMRFAYIPPGVSAIWLPAGIALAAFLIFGRWAWAGVMLGALTVGVTSGNGPLLSLMVSVGSTLEAMIGAYLLDRYARGWQFVDRPVDVVRFAVLAALGSTALGAALGVASLGLVGVARPAQYPMAWLTWWMGDASGIFVVTPLIVVLGVRDWIHWDVRRVLEGFALLALTVVLAQFVFGSRTAINHPLAYLPMPLFIWAAFRFGQRGAAVTVAVVYAVALFGTLRGSGPFATPRPNDSLLLLGVYTCIAAVTSMMLAAVVADRTRDEEQLRLMSTSDSLTGLANYGRLVEVLESEIQRSLRTERPFSALFLDVDGLKKMNDHHGHLVGSRALVRLAGALRQTCRTIDTAARYGGDEFAIVLPETDEEEALQVAARITDFLAADTEQPPVRVSIGVAVYPTDGDTSGALLAAADTALYWEKARGAKTGSAKG